MAVSELKAQQEIIAQHDLKMIKDGGTFGQLIGVATILYRFTLSQLRTTRDMIPEESR